MTKVSNKSQTMSGNKDAACEAWHRRYVERNRDWILMLSKTEIEALSKKSTVLREAALSKLRDELHLRLKEGYCFVLLRGLGKGCFSLSEYETILYRMGSLLGTLIPQSVDGSIIGHLVDQGSDWRETQPFHSDGGDILGLVCIRKAIRGGFTRLASSLAVHDELRRLNSSLLNVLYEEFHFHRRNRPGPPTFVKSIFSETKEGINCFYLPGTIRETPTRTGLPLSKEQRLALDLFDEVVNRADIYYRLLLLPGDLLLVNNRKVLHGRTAYEDSNDKAKQRLLLRIWIDATVPKAKG